MKKIWMMMVVALILIVTPNTIFAHSHLSSTMPADGEVKNEQVQSVILYFDGKIMEGSYVEITQKEDGVVSDVSLVIGEGELLATPRTPLKNGNYDVKWSIISADGHPLEGEFSFTIDAPVEEVENEEATEAENIEAEVQENADVNENNQLEEDESNNIIFILIGAAVLLLAVSGFIVAKRKK